MATTKVTITLPDDQFREIRALVRSRRAASVSGFVQHAVKIALWDAAGWAEMLREGLEQTGGPLTDKERAWADRVLNQQPRKRSVRKPRAA